MPSSFGNTTPNTETVKSQNSLTDISQEISERYKILDCLGKGGMGTVYLADDLIIERKVAIKVLSYENASNEQKVRFQQEAKVSGKLNHPHIVKTYDFGFTKSGQLFLVMEHINGIPLDTWIKENGRIQVKHFTAIFASIADALSHASVNNIVHRDIKPSNILLDVDKGEPHPFVVDFGIAKILHSDSVFDTKTGMIVGTPQYISPEQVLQTEVDERSDVYSLGCVMYEALSGKPPYVANSTLELLDKHQNEPFPEFAKELKDILPEEIESIIKTAMKKDPGNRYQSMQELKSALNITPEASVSIINSNQIESKTNNKHKLLMPIGFSIMVVAISILAFLLYTKNEKQGSKKMVPQIAKVNTKKQEAKSKEIDSFALDMRYNEKMKSKKEKLQDLRSGKTESYSTLSISYLPDVVDKDLSFLANHKNLTDLNLSGTGVSKNVISVVSTIPTLEKIRLSQINLSGADMESLTKLPKLSALELNACNLSDKELESLSKLGSLQILSIRANPRLTDRGISKLSKSKSLNFLDISQTRVTDLGLKSFKGSGHLEIVIQKCPLISSIQIEKLSKDLGVKKLDSNDFRKQALEEYFLQEQ